MGISSSSTYYKYPSVRSDSFVLTSVTSYFIHDIIWQIVCFCILVWYNTTPNPPTPPFKNAYHVLWAMKRNSLGGLIGVRFFRPCWSSINVKNMLKKNSMEFMRLNVYRWFVLRCSTACNGHTSLIRYLGGLVDNCNYWRKRGEVCRCVWVFKISILIFMRINVRSVINWGF